MILYRAMCEKEFQDTIANGALSWNSRFKWFGTKDFVLSRVMDGKFNNSAFVRLRYSKLIEIEVDEDSMKHFRICGNGEYMLDVRKVPLVKIKAIRPK